LKTAFVKILLSKIYRVAYREITSVTDFIALGLNLPCRTEGSFAGNSLPKIVFIGEGLMPRVSRMARWVRRSGKFSVILVAGRITFVEEFSNDAWDGVYLFRNQYHLRRILKQMKGVYLYHAFAPKSFYPDLVRLTVKEPFLIDVQDVFSCYYGLNPGIRWLKEELPHERNCLLRSDGIVAQSLEPNIAIRRFGEGTKPPAIFFPLYCDNDMFRVNTKILDPRDIHIVYAGGVAGSHRDRSHYGSIQFHGLIGILDAQKIHFHIYPSPSNIRADYEEYEQIALEKEYFHFHTPVAQDQMATEMNRYHFGILPFFSAHSGQSGEKYRVATALKLFNYIEAGLPILVSEDLVYQSWIVSRYEAGIPIGKDDPARLREIILKYDYSMLAANLARRREEISLEMHIPRLLKFYGEAKGRCDSNS